jgi:hypothetical protein
VPTTFPRAAVLVAWGTACLQGRTSPDEAGDRISGDERNRVVGLGQDPDPVSWAVALGLLRAGGAEALRLVLPHPGDVLGAPGPREVVEAAAAAGEAAVTVGGPPLALVPTVSPEGDAVRWDALPCEPTVGSAGLPSVAEAEREVADSMREGIAALEGLGLARGRDDLASRLAAVDRRSRSMSLPPGFPARAVRLVEQATRLAAVVSLAREDDGAAVTSAEALRREDALRPLARTARRAMCAGYSAAAEPVPGRG